MYITRDQLLTENTELRRKLANATAAWELTLELLVQIRRREDALLAGHDLVPGDYTAWFAAVEACIRAARERREEQPR